MKEKVLWGRKHDAEEWQEEILSTNEKRFDEIKQMAARDGYGHFRISTLDLSRNPSEDFLNIIPPSARKAIKRRR